MTVYPTRQAMIDARAAEVHASNLTCGGVFSGDEEAARGAGEEIGKDGRSSSLSAETSAAAEKVEFLSSYDFLALTGSSQPAAHGIVLGRTIWGIYR